MSRHYTEDRTGQTARSIASEIEEEIGRALYHQGYGTISLNDEQVKALREAYATVAKLRNAFPKE